MYTNIGHSDQMNSRTRIRQTKARKLQAAAKRTVFLRKAAAQKKKKKKKLKSISSRE